MKVGTEQCSVLFELVETRHTVSLITLISLRYYHFYELAVST